MYFFIMSVFGENIPRSPEFFQQSLKTFSWVFFLIQNLQNNQNEKTLNNESLDNL